MKEGFLYTGEHTREISFPLGGIGSGCVGLAGNLRLVDWEIFNRPAKGSTNGFSHFAVKAEEDDELIQLIDQGKVEPAEWISDVIPWREYQKGFGWVRDKKSNKVVLDFTG